MDRDISVLIAKLHNLTTQYMELEDDNLANAGEFSRLSWEIEETAMQLCILNTDLSEDDLINYLDSHFRN